MSGTASTEMYTTCYILHSHSFIISHSSIGPCCVSTCVYLPLPICCYVNYYNVIIVAAWGHSIAGVVQAYFICMLLCTLLCMRCM